MSLDSIEREYLKFLQKKLKESKQVAEPKAKQEQVAPSLPEAVASEAPVPRKRKVRGECCSYCLVS
jgi:hypothetical protein